MVLVFIFLFFVVLFYTFEDVIRFGRVVRGFPVDVSEELRGWRWSEYPVVHVMISFL